MTAVSASGRARPAQAEDVPYPGLDPFLEERSDFFFGRERDRELIAANLEGARLTLFYGPSGVGKSSVLLAGVVNDLRAEAIERLRRQPSPPTTARFAICALRDWIEPPLHQLMERIRLSAMEALGGTYLEPWRPGTPPVESVREWTKHVRLLLVVLDQFEEYFVYHPPSNAEGSFDVEFARLVTEPRLQIHFLLSMREDAIASLDRFKTRIPDLYENRLRIDRLDLEAAREAIVGPIRRYAQLHGEGSADIEPALVDALLASDDVRVGDVDGNGSGVRVETSFLQLVLRRLWLEEPDEQIYLSVSDLEAIGGTQRIVERHLEEALEALGDKQDIAVDVFRQLVTPSKSKVAHTAEDLAELVDRPADEIKPVLEQLCLGNRILRRVVPPRRPGGDPLEEPPPRYEIFHDVLADPILRWRTAQMAERNARAERAAAEQELHRRLKEEEEKKHAAQLQSARDHRRALISYGLLGLALAAIGFSVFELVSLRSKNKEASAQQSAFQSVFELPVNPDQSVRDALKSVGKRWTPIGERALRVALPSWKTRAVLPTPRDRPAVGAALGPNNVVAVVGGFGGGYLWDWQTRHELAHLVSGTRYSRADFSADGKRLLTTGGGGSALWDVRACLSAQRCSPLHRFRGALLSNGAISADGRLVSLVTFEGLRTWRCGTDCEPAARERRAGPDFPTAVAYGGSRYVASGWYGHGTVIVRDLTGSRPEKKIGTKTRYVSDLAVSSDGHYLAAAYDRNVRVYDLNKACTGPCTPLRVFHHGDWVNSVAFSSDNSTLATTSDDGIARVWNPTTTTPLMSLRGHSDTVSNASFGPQGKRLVTASGDGTARVWDVDTGSVFGGNRSAVTQATFSADRTRVLTVGADGTARIFDRAGNPTAILLVTASRRVLTPAERRRAEAAPPAVSGGRLPKRAAEPIGGRVAAAAFDATGAHVTTADENGAVKRFDVEGCERQFVCSASGMRTTRDEYFGAAAVSPDGRYVAGSTDPGVEIRDFDTGRKLGGLSLPGDATANVLAFDSRGDFLAIAPSRGPVWIWPVADCIASSKCKPSVTLRNCRVVSALAFNPDGSRLAVGCRDHQVRLWAWQSAPRRVVRAISDPTTDFQSIAFNDTGKHLVTGGSDGATRVWNTATGELEGVLESHAGRVTSVQFRPDDRKLRILTASEDGTAKLNTCGNCGTIDVVRRWAEDRLAEVEREPVWLERDAP